MPKGSDCNPVQEWWQGTTTYYIFVPSFQDTDGNGFGDLSGVIKRLDYLEGLGVKSIRLSPIYPSESFVDDYVLPNNYTDVAPILGDARDLHLLSALLHEREMFLILDMPLTQPGGGVGQGNKAGVDLELELPSILSFWMKYGVDGFAFTDLHKLGDLNDLVPGIHAWRNILDAQTLGLHRRVMMVPLKLMKRLEHEASAVLPRVQKVFNLIDVVLDTSQTAEEIATVIDDATRWDDHPSLPWINWRIGGPFEPRINDKASGTTSLSTIPALGFSLLQLFLPGSVTLYYGDEIGLYLNEPDKLDFSWAVPMAWSPDDGGFSKGEPWLSMGGDWERRNVVSMNDSLATLRTMIEARTEKIRFASGELLIIDRYYPRRHKFALVINLGPHTLEKDLSKLYFGGQVLVSSYDKEGYVRFKNITLRPREAM
ncbi:Alpha-glucosidase, partial [Armadillidium nasatum]